MGDAVPDRDLDFLHQIILSGSVVRERTRHFVQDAEMVAHPGDEGVVLLLSGHPLPYQTLTGGGFLHPFARKNQIMDDCDLDRSGHDRVSLGCGARFLHEGKGVEAVT